MDHLWADIQNVILPIFTALGAVVVVGGGFATIAYNIFKVFGEKWLNAKFVERLAAYRHAQQRELEQLKFEINTLMDRTMKLHQREFDVLPETWGLLTDAFNTTVPIALGFIQYPDVNRMSDDQLGELLEKSPLVGWEKTELKAAADKTKYYANAIFRSNFDKAGEACTAFRVYLSKHGIFIPEPIKAKFAELDALLTNALLERRLSIQNPRDTQMFDVGNTLHTRGRELLKSLEQDVQRRLWSVRATEDKDEWPGVLNPTTEPIT
jgi:hypothetical protein